MSKHMHGIAVGGDATDDQEFAREVEDLKRFKEFTHGSVGAAIGGPERGFPEPDWRGLHSATVLTDLGAIVGGPAPTKLQQFDQAAARVTHDRGAVYGHPSVDFARVAKLKAVVAECEDPLARHVLEMLCVKIARLIHSPDHLDSWIDVAGYARTGVMLLEPPTEGE